MQKSKIKQHIGKKVVLIILFLRRFLLSLRMWGGKKKPSIPETNKSLPRNESYVVENNFQDNEYKIFHLSFDDTINIFKDITEKKDKYSSIFENSTLEWLKTLHEETGIKVSFYVFLSSKDFSLAQCTTKFKKEFEDNSNWLRFGFHSAKPGKIYGNENGNGILEDYNSTIRHLYEIAGYKSIDHVIRLESFQGTCSGILSLANNSVEPVVGLYGPDDGRKCYYLDTNKSAFLYCHDSYYDTENGLWFISSDVRVEYVACVKNKIKEFSTDAWNNQMGIVEIFSHEWEINILNKYKINELCRWAYNNGYVFEFLENILETQTKPV